MTSREPLRLRRLEETLRAAPGIRGARVEVPRPGELIVRVVAIPEKDKESLVRAVQGFARTHGYEVPAENIEVLVSSVEERGARRKLSYLSVTRAADSVTARVGLELSGDTLIGEREVGLGSDDEMRAVVEATLNAVGQITDVPLRVQSVDVLQVGEGRVIVVALIGPTGTWVGSAQVGTDLLHAGARATMKALNRSLERWLEP